MLKRKRLIAVAVALLIAMACYLAYARWTAHDNSRESLLQQLPVAATSVLYVDVAQLREGNLLQNLATWTASSVEDPEYQAFTRETGFDYARDLNRFALTFETRNSGKAYFAIADGRFDRKKISAYLRKNGPGRQANGREIFDLPSNTSGRNISLAFLSDDRVALTDGDMNSELESASREAGHREWMQHFERLSGVPVFALLRQDAAVGSVLSERAPGGIASPQLAQLLNQLTWVSIAGKLEGNSFRAVIDGECPNEVVLRQLQEFFNGIALLAEAGLNDPKLRQKMDPAEREAYLQLLSSIDVTKLDRGDSKSVRVSLLITPEAWSKLSALSERATQGSNPRPSGIETPTPSKSKNKNAGAKAPAGHN